MNTFTVPAWIANACVSGVADALRSSHRLSGQMESKPRGSRSPLWQPAWPQSPNTPVFAWDENGVVDEDSDDEE